MKKQIELLNKSLGELINDYNKKEVPNFVTIVRIENVRNALLKLDDGTK